MKIYEYAGFPNPARIRIALAEKGLTDQVEFVSVDVPNGEHQKPEFFAKNPAGYCRYRYVPLPYRRTDHIQKY